MQLQFCPLFSGSSGNAIYVGTDKTKILIDAGLSGAKITAEMAKIGLTPCDLTAILVTHEHADHINGVGVLSRRYHLPIYASTGTWAAMSAKLGAIDAPCRVLFEAGEDFSIGDLYIRPFPIPHDAADPVGYAVSAAGAKVAVATDIGVVRESWLRELEGADVLLLEANHDVDTLKAGRYPYELKRRILSNRGHLSNDDAGAAAAEMVRRGVRVIVLGHLSGENNFPELAYASVACVLEQAGIRPGRDVMLSVARRDGHSELFVLGEGVDTHAVG